MVSVGRTSARPNVKTSRLSSGTAIPNASVPIGRSSFGVADIIRANLKNGKEIGTSCCVYLDGQPVVDIWGGWADRDQTRPWAKDTIVPVYSTTKGVSAVIIVTGPEKPPE